MSEEASRGRARWVAVARSSRAVRSTLAAGAAVTFAATLVASASPAFANGGVSVRANVPVTATNLIAKTANNSPSLASDPTDRRFVVIANRIDGPDFSCALQASGDGGASWVSPALPKLPEGAEKCYAPEVSFDRRGTLYYLFVGLAGNGNRPMGVYLTTSSDRARSFTTPRKVLGPERYGVRMALDPTMGPSGRIHLVWVEVNAEGGAGNGFPTMPNPIMAAYSDDGGRTLSKPHQISDPERPRVVAPALALGPNHAVHVLYYDIKDDVRDYAGLEGPTWDGTWALVATSSRDGGRSFSPGTVVESDLVPPERVMLIFTMAPPALVADGAGRLYAGWTDARHGDWDVFVRPSLDGGRAWQKARRVNDDPIGDKRNQYMPRLAVSPQGRLDVAFYDRRGNVENRGNDVYYAYSADHGNTFARNVRLSSWDSDSMIGYEYAIPSAAGLVEFGSRLALLSERSRVLAAWTDTRNNALGPPSQDIWAGEVAFPHARGIPPLLIVAAGAFAVIGGAAAVGRRRGAAAALEGLVAPPVAEGE